MQRNVIVARLIDALEPLAVNLILMINPGFLYLKNSTNRDLIALKVSSIVIWKYCTKKYKVRKRLKLKYTVCFTVIMFATVVLSYSV